MPGPKLPTPILYALLNQLQDAVFVIEDGMFIYVNPQVVALIGFPESALLSRPFSDFIHDDDREMVIARYRARCRGEKVPHEYSFHVVTQTGAIREVNMRVGVVTEEQGRIITIGSLQDITEQRKTQLALAHSQADIASILDNMPEVFYRTDMEGLITMMSPSCREEIGYTPEEMVGRPMAEFYCDPTEREGIVQALMAGEGKARQVEACMLHKSGHPIWVSTNAHIRFDEDGRPLCVEGIARNISERKEMEEQLRQLSRIDGLTQLLNRRQFLLEAETQLEVALRYQRPLAVIMLDLDRFKSVNDHYGHQVGDKVLAYFADGCRLLFRKTDIVGRMGGEEFAVLMPESTGEAALEMVQRLRHYLQEQPLLTEEGKIALTFSAGLVTLSTNNRDLDSLLRQADQFLYMAKERGRNQVVSDEGIGEPSML